MRPLLKYGIPAAAGLATGGYALSQGEDPGSAALAGVGGALGGAAGLLGARLAGKYSPGMVASLQKNVGIPAANVIGDIGRRVPVESKVRAGMVGSAADLAAKLSELKLGERGQRRIGKAIAAGAVPAGALTAGLGGVALGAIPGSMGMPGFQQNAVVDPESYGSSNSAGAIYKTPTLQYM